MWRILAGIGLTFWIVVFSITLFLSPDSLDSCSDTPSSKPGCLPADAIIAVSGGDTDGRTNEAIKLYKNGWAPLLIFSGAASDKSGPSNAAVMEQHAIQEGVPEEDILVEQTSENTKENAVNTADILLSSNVKSAILVTSPYHQKRVLLEFQSRAPSVEFRSHPIVNDPQWSTRWWWLTPSGWYLTVSELVKLLIVYTNGTR